MDDEKLKKFAYINISSYRANAVRALNKGKETPTHIAKDAGIRVNHISKVLRELKECNIAVCLNEQDKKNRIYKLTEEGQEIADFMEKY